MHVQEVGLAGMLSLLTAVLLHTTASGSPASTEPDYTALPHNFCAVAQLVLRLVLCWAASIYCICSYVFNMWTHQQSDSQQQ